MQAIVESDPFGIDYNTLKEEKQIGQEYAGKLGCEYSSFKMTNFAVLCINHHVSDITGCSGWFGQKCSLDCLRNKVWCWFSFSLYYIL